MSASRKTTALASSFLQKLLGIPAQLAKRCAPPGSLREALSRELLRHHAARTANALAFDFFLALVPMLGLAGWIASTYLAPLLHTDAAANISVFQGTPRHVREFLEANLEAMSDVDLAPIAMISGIWLSSAAFHTFFAITMPRETPVWKIRAWSLVFAIGGLLLLASGSTVGVVLTLDSIGLLERFVPTLNERWTLRFIGVLFGLVAVTSFVGALLRVALGNRRVLAGAFVATITGSFASLVLAIFTRKLGNYALYYGGLAAVVGLLLWLWTWCWALLLGAQLTLLLDQDKPSYSLDESTPRLVSEPPPSQGPTQGASEDESLSGTQTPRLAGNPEGAWQVPTEGQSAPCDDT